MTDQERRSYVETWETLERLSGVLSQSPKDVCTDEACDYLQESTEKLSENLEYWDVERKEDLTQHQIDLVGFYQDQRDRVMDRTNEEDGVSLDYDSDYEPIFEGKLPLEPVNGGQQRDAEEALEIANIKKFRPGMCVKLRR